MSDGNDARHEPRERHEPTRLNGQDPKQSHAGNGTVNHGPDDQGPDRQGPADLGSEERETAAERKAGDEPPKGLDGLGDLDGLDGLGSDELALRRLLHQAVQDVEPREGALDHLRRAVPARRARKRQAAVGMAAAALFVCTAVPALVHVSNSTGSDANPSAVGHAWQAQGGASEGKGPDGGESAAGSSSGKAAGKPDGKKGDGKGKGGSGAGAGVTEGANPSSSTAAGSAPMCTAAELGTAIGSSGAPDSTGAVYGSFSVSNVSSAACTVGGPGSVVPTAAGAADPARVGAARHVAGDAAAGLPDPSTEAAALVLDPGTAYEVKFAWVPSDTCPTNGSGGTTNGGTDPGPSPDPTPSDNPSTDTGTSTGGDTGMSTQMVTEGGTADGSVTITYTAETGATAAVTISNACAGTVYWTGVLAAQA